MTKSKTPPTLKEYQKKRNFEVTSEPSGSSKTKPVAKSDLLYVIQKHAATNLHYDFRLSRYLDSRGSRCRRCPSRWKFEVLSGWKKTTRIVGVGSHQVWLRRLEASRLAAHQTSRPLRFIRGRAGEKAALGRVEKAPGRHRARQSRERCEGREGRSGGSVINNVGQPILAAPDLSRSGTGRLESRLQAGLPAPRSNVQ